MAAAARSVRLRAVASPCPGFSPARGPCRPRLRRRSSPTPSRPAASAGGRSPNRSSCVPPTRPARRPRARPGGASRCPTSERRPRRTSPGTGRRRAANAPTSTSSSTARATCPPRAARSATIWPPSATTWHVAPHGIGNAGQLLPGPLDGSRRHQFRGHHAVVPDVLDLKPNPSSAAVPRRASLRVLQRTALLDLGGGDRSGLRQVRMRRRRVRGARLRELARRGCGLAAFAIPASARAAAR